MFVSLDLTERLNRGLLAAILALLTWGFGLPRAEAIVTLLLGVAILISAVAGRCPIEGFFDPVDAPDAHQQPRSADPRAGS